MKKNHIDYSMPMSNSSSEFAFCWWKYCCHCYYLSCWYYFIQVTKFISSCYTFKKLEYYNCKTNFMQYHLCAYFVQNRWINYRSRNGTCKQENTRSMGDEMAVTSNIYSAFCWLRLEQMNNSYYWSWLQSNESNIIL